MVIRESCRVMMLMRSMIMLVMVMMMGENEEAIESTYICMYIYMKITTTFSEFSY